MAFHLGPMAASPDVGQEFRNPKRQSLIRTVLSQKKRWSRNNPILHPDPFRYGDPNPLDCHPYISDKHSDYIHRPHTIPRPLSFPVISSATGAGRLSSYGQDDLDAYRSQGFVPRPLRADSLVAILEFFESNTLSRAMANSAQPARKPPEILSPQQKLSSPALVRRHSDISLDEVVKGHEASMALKIVEENRDLQNCNLTPITPPSTPPKENFCPTPTRRPIADSEPSIEQFAYSGLPKGWTAIHDRFIAYLDTHAPLTSDGEIPFRESKKPRYTVEQIISLLKERFDRFQSIPIPAWAIERRLEILDYRDNDYFDVPYWCYDQEIWGKGI